MNQLRDQDIEKIVNGYENFKDLDKFSRVVELDEIKENDWNLSVPRYVDIFDPPEQIDIQHVWNNIKKIENEREKAEKKLVEYLRDIGFE